MTVKSNPLTRKAGPLPVWGWAALAVGVWFLFFRGSSASASQGASLPYTPTSGSGAQQPVSGQGSPADNGSSDLLSALGDNATAQDALLAALQSGYGGGYGVAGSGGTGTSGVSAATVSAPAVTDNTQPAAVDPTVGASPSDPAVIAAAGDQPVTGYLAPSADAGYIIDPTTGQVYTGSSSIEGGLRQRVGQPYQADALGRYLTNSIGYDPAVSSTPTVGGPTVTQVQAAPADTTGVLNAQTADVSTQATDVSPTTPGSRATIPKPVAA